MSPEQQNIFSQIKTYPNADARRSLDGLHGIDEIRDRLIASVRVVLNPTGLKKWAGKHHPKAVRILDYVLKRPQVFALVGDVGTGKTTLAESFGDKVAQLENIEVHLYKLSLSVRGNGVVGEMTKLISDAFAEVAQVATKAKGTDGVARAGFILLIDEADAIAQSREMKQMHHEDRAGVNALITGIDKLAKGSLPVAVILCTNRSDALDPAIKRRIGEIFEFIRPDENRRKQVLTHCLDGVGFTDDQISTLSKEIGPRQDCSYGFTYSDIVQRLIPSMVLNEYPDNAINFEKTLGLIKNMKATPPFGEGQS